MKQILVTVPGGPESMVLADVPVPEVPAGHVLVAIHLSGVNFLDAYYRSGLYKAEIPVTIGSEAAGVIERVGEGVTGLGVGDRVAYVMVRGSYAEYALVPAEKVVKIPDEVPFETAAAVAWHRSMPPDNGPTFEADAPPAKKKKKKAKAR